MTKYLFLNILFCGLCFINIGFAQLEDDLETIELNGELVTMYVTEDNDTLLLANLEDVSVSSLRNFEDQAEYRRYLKYRRYANVVFPYATEAIKIFRESEEVTNTMKKGKRKKHYKRLQKELKDEFEEPLKKLTKTQGKILIKMIEKELDTPFYSLVRNLRGRVTASYWNTLGYMYGYRMKEGYTEGEDAVLDAVLHDFDISYQ